MDAQDEEGAEMVRLLTRSRNVSEARAREIIAESKVDGKELTRSKAIWGTIYSFLAFLATGGLVVLQFAGGGLWIGFAILLITAFVMATASFLRFFLQLRGVLTKREVRETLMPH